MKKNESINPGKYTSLGYAAATFTRENGKQAGPRGGADLHVLPDRLDLLRQSQSFMRNNGLYKGIVSRLLDNILGTGAILQSKTSDPKLNTQLESLWKKYWKKPEVRGIFTGRKVERMVASAVIVDGDFGTVKTNLGKIQLVESELIHTPAITNAVTGNQIIHGVEVDTYGAPVAYYRDRYSRYGYLMNNPKRIDAKDFIFVANMERASQTRGVPVMTASFPNFHRVNDICDSEAICWQLLSKLALAVTKKGMTQTANTLTETNPDAPILPPSSTGLRTEQIEDGTVFYADGVDESIAGIDRNIPGKDFTANMTMFLRMLGLPIGIPLELLLLDWSKTNYSSARAALEQFFLMILSWQEEIKDYLTCINEWKIQEWIDADELPDADDIFEHDWILPQSPWVDALKESQAQGEQLDRSLTTHGDALKSLNRDRIEFLGSRKREVLEAIATAEEINAAHPDANVPWEIFAGLKAPGVMQAVAKMEQDAPDEETPDPQTPDTQAPDKKEVA